MRQVMPHRNNIDIDGCTCKSFFHPLRRRRLKALNGGMLDRASGCENLEIFACSISSLPKRIGWGESPSHVESEYQPCSLDIADDASFGDF